MAGKYKIVMVRHGESEWNQQNLFCGWFDAALSDKGRAEALAAGKAVKEGRFSNRNQEPPNNPITSSPSQPASSST